MSWVGHGLWPSLVAAWLAGATLVVFAAGCSRTSTKKDKDGDAPKPAAAYWPQWRGPGRDGVTDGLPGDLGKMRLVWKQPMRGVAHAGPAIAEGCIVVADSDCKTDYFQCYELATGKLRWTCTQPNGVDIDAGNAPRATPLIDRGRAYCLTAIGRLLCLRMTDGQVVWQRDLLHEDANGKLPTWGFSCAPLLAGGRLIVNPGGPDAAIIALDPATGAVQWRGPGGRANYSAFIVGRLGGVEQIVGYDDHLSGWRIDTGEQLWRLKVQMGGGFVVPTPVATADGRLLVTSPQSTRLYGFDSAGRIVPTPVAESRELRPQMSTPTLATGLVLCGDKGVQCLDAGNLTPLWECRESRTTGSLTHIVATPDARRAAVFCDDGTIVLMGLSREQAKVLGQTKVCDRTWAHPAVSGGWLVCRDAKRLYCYTLGCAGDVTARSIGRNAVCPPSGAEQPVSCLDAGNSRPACPASGPGRPGRPR